MVWMMLPARVGRNRLMMIGLFRQRWAHREKKYGVTHWSSRLLAQHLGMGNATVARAWRSYGVQPWRCQTFKFSTDPELVGKVTDVVGLYLAPPENAIVLCVDEKSQIQALDRTAPMLPMRQGDGRAAHSRLQTSLAPSHCSPLSKLPLDR